VYIIGSPIETSSVPTAPAPHWRLHFTSASNLLTSFHAIAVQDFFAPTGPVAQRLAGFELRPQQQEMAAAVEHAFARGQHLIAEAGTGVGKSFAYLVPAIAQAANRKKLSSPPHHSLQEQLIEKDIPFLQAVSGLEFSAVLCKGRGNYLCLRRLEQASKKSFSILPDARSADDLIMVETWAKNTKDGSLSTCRASPPGRSGTRSTPSAATVSAAAAATTMAASTRSRAGASPMAKSSSATRPVLLRPRPQKYDHRSRNPEKGGRGILPAYDLAVLDEAHTIEAVASDHFGLSVSESQVRYLLHSLSPPKPRVASSPPSITSTPLPRRKPSTERSVPPTSSSICSTAG